VDRRHSSSARLGQREGFGGGSNGGGQRSHGRGRWKVSVCNRTELVGAVVHNYANGLRLIIFLSVSLKNIELPLTSLNSK